MKNDVMTFILAGGAGSRLGPLTQNRSKPSVPFGGKFRIIDFMMSNCLNSGMFRIMVLVQHQAQGLIDHLQHNWPSAPHFGYYMNTVPPQQMFGDVWYRGTADAVHQNMAIVARRGEFETAAILSGDHIVTMDLSQMYEFHKEKGAIFTVCAMAVPAVEASGRFGVIEVDAENRIIGFEEKPECPKEIPGKPGLSFISLGNYFARMESLNQALEENALDPDNTHDFAKDIIPKMVRAGAAIYAYDFENNKVPGQQGHYWRDVGTVKSFWEANMDLVSLDSELNIYNKKWPILTPNDDLPPAKYTKNCLIVNSTTGSGCIIEDTTLERTIIGREVNTYQSHIVESIIFSDVIVGTGCELNRVIVDRQVNIPAGTKIGIDLDLDRSRGLYVDDESGVVIVPRCHSMF